MDISGQIALITGAASGLGEASARYLAEKGAKLVLIDTNEDALQLLANQLNALPLCVDVTDPKAVENAFLQIEQHNGQGIRIAIQCAGICPAERIVGKDGVAGLDLFSRVIQVNLVGTFNIMRLAADHMMKQTPLADNERGVIINTASVAAFEGQIGQAAYSASKGGVVSMTLPAAREFAQFGLRVMAIAPGIMQTPMIASMPETIQTSLAESIPFPKRLGKPEEFAQLAASIIENPFLNGSVIRLDGAVRMAAR